MRNYTFTLQSEVNTTKEILWQHITQMKNVNHELMPFAKMTYPKEMSEIAGREVPLHRGLFKSVILFLGVIPVDLHTLRFDKVEHGVAFFEHSYSLQHHYWKHTRVLFEDNGKTFINDTVDFAPRIPFMGHLLLPVYKTIFANRHKQLQKYFA